ncbi:MAG: hypothetical protein P8Y70_02990 [Candidatus Lokiarchaeota archaeon]
MAISDPSDMFEILLKEGYSEEQISQELNHKFKQFHGFISKEGALFLVAKDLGIDLKSPNVDESVYEDIEQEIDYDEFIIPIKDLSEGMTNNVLLGKVSRIFKINDFIRKDGSPGRVGSFLLADRTGQVKIVVWDNDTEIMLSDMFEIGIILRVIGGYCKKGRNEYLEVHLGKKVKIMLSPEDIDERKRKELENLPVSLNEKDNNTFSINEKVKIRDLFEKEGYISSIVGQVQNLELKEINKTNGEKTFLLKFLLTDETSSIKCLIWNMKAIEVLRKINNGDIVEIQNVLLRINTYTKEKELHFTNKTMINK